MLKVTIQLFMFKIFKQFFCIRKVDPESNPQSELNKHVLLWLHNKIPFLTAPQHWIEERRINNILGQIKNKKSEFQWQKIAFSVFLFRSIFPLQTYSKQFWFKPLLDLYVLNLCSLDMRSDETQRKSTPTSTRKLDRLHISQIVS